MDDLVEWMWAPFGFHAWLVAVPACAAYSAVATLWARLSGSRAACQARGGAPR